ncbi:hypothetical protein [Leptothermofonsia sp. ETS-13]|uniref:hypothetical protein n=1 Tax=Leptothermofonsia sp. ETS-13 TaxID=3035696 RepID=UPI003BA069DE
MGYVPLTFLHGGAIALTPFSLNWEKLYSKLIPTRHLSKRNPSQATRVIMARLNQFSIQKPRNNVRAPSANYGTVATA